MKNLNLFTTLQHLVPQQRLSQIAGRIASSEQPLIKKALIEGFTKVYHIKLDEYQRQNLQQYQSFNDFFTRELKDNARPLDKTTNGIICPADGTISQIGDIKQGKLLQAKGREYDVGQLVADYKEGQALTKGKFATIYLAPSNYHRVHMPFSGKLIKTRYVPGTLFSVNNTTADHVPDLFARNERLVCTFETDFGQAHVVMVGAMIVAGIESVATGKITRSEQIQENQHDIDLNKGDELGRFYLGSTAIVLLPETAQATWQTTLQHGHSVKMGQLLGVCQNIPSSQTEQTEQNDKTESPKNIENH